MALNFSTGLRTYIAGTGSFKAGLTSFFIDVYSGVRPASADDAPTGTLLATFSVNHAGTGATWGTASAGVLDRNSAETVQYVGLAAGTAGWFRVRLAGDLGTTNTTDRRVDGTIANSGGDMNMTNLAITVGAIRTLDSFPITFPASC